MAVVELYDRLREARNGLDGLVSVEMGGLIQDTLWMYSAYRLNVGGERNGRVRLISAIR